MNDVLAVADDIAVPIWGMTAQVRAKTDLPEVVQ
jgi:hypothetical protein